MGYALYVHIPFCRRRCRYCDFYSTAAAEVPQAYLDALLAAFEKHAPKGADGRPLPPDTVYLGGGTPSLLSGPQAARLLGAFSPPPGAEVTLEANPESAGEEKLAAFRAAGVNRLSLGLQSARDESLRALGRLHTAAEAAAALAAARGAGFENRSADIMLALPGYSEAEFDETLALAAQGGATHISAYLLKMEPGTPLAQSPPAGLPGPDEAADLYLYAVRRLAEAGFSRYEVSNFARPGFESRHNLYYWDCRDYLGLGPGAHSCMGGRRFSFAPDLPAFLRGAAPRQEGVCGAGDYLMLRLRLEAGFSEAELRRRFGCELDGGQREFLDSLVQSGLARRREGEDGYALTTQGLLVQNSILARLL